MMRGDSKRGRWVLWSLGVLALLAGVVWLRSFPVEPTRDAPPPERVATHPAAVPDAPPSSPEIPPSPTTPAIVPVIGDRTVFGAVYDISGKPVVGAEVSLSENPVSQDSFKFRARVMSDDDGRFAFPGLPEGYYQVCAASAGAVACETLRLLSFSTREVILVLQASGVLGGVVAGPDGRPVSGARLSILCAKRENAENRYPSCVSNAQGSFLFDGIPMGEYDVSAEADGYAPAVAEALTTGRTDYRIVLNRGGVISGIAVDAATGRPAADAVLRVARKTGWEGERLAACGADGRFTLGGLADGAYSFLGSTDGRTVTPFPLNTSIKDGQRRDGIEVRLTAGGCIAGRVYESESQEGIKGALLEIERDPREGNALRSVSTDADGRYAFDGLPPGNFRVQALYPPSYRKELAKRDRQIPLASGERRTDVDFAVKAGIRVSGVVVQSDGRPAPNADVSGIVETRDARMRTTPVYVQRTDANGEFVFAGFATGERVTLRATHPEYGRSDSLEYTVPAGGLPGIRVALKHGGTGSIAGRVQDDQGNPVAELVGASLHDSDGGSISGANTVSGADGRFVFPRLEAGSWRLSVMSLRFRQSFKAGDRPQSFVEVTLPPNGAVTDVVLQAPQYSGDRIAGRVVDELDVGIPGAWVTVRGENTESMVTTDPMGRFESAVQDQEMIKVTASHQDYYQPQDDALWVSSGDTDIVLVLYDKELLDGWVVDAATGRPVASCEIDSTSGLLPGTIVVNNPEGHFQLPLGRSRRITTLIVRARGYQSTEFQFSFAEEGLLDANGQPMERLAISLLPAADVLDWQVVDTSGLSVAEALVYCSEILTASRLETYQARYVADAEGRFTLEEPVPENGALTAYRADAGIGSVRVTGDSPGQNQIVIAPLASVSGTVVRADAALSGAAVLLTTVDERHVWVTNVTTDNRGYFEIRGIAQGNYEIKAFYGQDEQAIETQPQAITLSAAAAPPIVLRF